MCTVLLPPGDNPIAVNKYIISYQYYKIAKIQSKYNYILIAISGWIT